MKYDVFLSHNSQDKPAVELIARKLYMNGIEPFLDKWHLVPGEPWQEALEEALDKSQSCAIFFGPEGIGPWSNEEMRSALEWRVRAGDFRVIPVLLPGTQRPERPNLPRFLSRLTWVDFREGLEDEEALKRLVAGIKGVAPGGALLNERRLETETIKHTLHQHRLWIESAGKEGLQANFSGQNLQGANLSQSTLNQAILSGADLTDADLSRADLTLAALVDTVLRRADLRRANLFRADLSRSDLTAANLDGANLAQSNLEDCVGLDRSVNLDKAGIPGRLWLEARRHLDQYEGAVLAVKPIWGYHEVEADPNLCFILMPFSTVPPFDQVQEVYQVHMKPTLERFGLTCYRADDIFGPNAIMEDIWHYILKARLVVADVTGRNPNVFYELGIAHTVGRQAIVITQNEDDVPFDIRAFRYLKYSVSPLHLRAFEKQLEQTVATVLQRLPRT
jgi:hypothetical protein